MDINLTKKEGVKLKTAGKYCQEDINVKPVLQNKNINANGTYTADNNYAGLGTVTVSMTTATIKLQEKSATPKTTSQVITPDNGYDGLSKVTVNPIPNNYHDTSKVDAVEADVVEGKTFVKQDGTVAQGSIVTNDSYQTIGLTSAQVSFNFSGTYYRRGGHVYITVYEGTGEGDITISNITS